MWRSTWTCPWMKLVNFFLILPLLVVLVESSGFSPNDFNSLHQKDEDRLKELREKHEKDKQGMQEEFEKNQKDLEGNFDSNDNFDDMKKKYDEKVKEMEEEFSKKKRVIEGKSATIPKEAFNNRGRRWTGNGGKVVYREFSSGSGSNPKDEDKDDEDKNVRTYPSEFGNILYCLTGFTFLSVIASIIMSLKKN